MDRKNYQAAKAVYTSALNEAENEDDKAVATYGLARAHGYLCEFRKSERYFLESIRIRSHSGLRSSNSGYVSQNMLELAELYRGNSKWHKANTMYARAIPLVEKFDILNTDPIGYTRVLDGYVKSLRKVGHSAKAEAIARKIQRIKAENPSRSANFTPSDYRTNCR